MSDTGLFLLNEGAAFLTMLFVFPGLFPPKDAMEVFIVSVLFICISVVWPLYLIASPITFLILYFCGDLDNVWKDEWPFKRNKP